MAEPTNTKTTMYVKVGHTGPVRGGTYVALKYPKGGLHEATRSHKQNAFAILKYFASIFFNITSKCNSMVSPG